MRVLVLNRLETDRLKTLHASMSPISCETTAAESEESADEDGAAGAREGSYSESTSEDGCESGSGETYGGKSVSTMGTSDRGR